MTELTVPSPTLLVTGGYGRLGKLLVCRLRNRGQRVVSLVRSLADGAHPDDVAVDLIDHDVVQRLVAESGADVLVHLACVVRGEESEATNRRIDLAIVNAARSAGIRHVVHASSGAVYGVMSPDALDEHAELNGDGPYVRSKIFAEQTLSSLGADDARACISSLRIFNIAGPSFPDSLVQRLARADSSHPVRVSAPDQFIRDYIHQDDLVDVLCAAIDFRDPGCRIVNVGAGVAVTTRMLLESIGPDVAYVEEIEGPPSANWANTSKMVRLFGASPRAVPDRTWDDR